MDFFAIFAVVLAIIILVNAVQVIPQQSAVVIERLGKYHMTLDAGLHFTVPFVDKIRYRHRLKEVVMDIPPQICITKDNVQVHVDGVLFYRVTDPKRASYGVDNYEIAIMQLCQTSLRSEVGKLDLDRTFEEREKINNAVILAIDNATDPWGVKVLRYEIKTITPPKDILDAMEKQMRAEREKRAKILESEGDRDSKINRAEGIKQETIKNSEANKQSQINEAEGEASAILSVTSANALGLQKIAQAISSQGGLDAAKLQLGEEYLRQLAILAQNAKPIIIPANLADPSSLIVTAMSVFDNAKGPLTPSPNPTPRGNSGSGLF